MKTFIKILSITITIFCLTTTNALAWFNSGHILIAKIAYDKLDKDAKQEVDRLISILEFAEPSYNDFIQASTWLDDVKGNGVPYFTQEHYISKYLMAEEGLKKPYTDKDNVMTATQRTIKILKDDRSSDFAKALALRIFIHTVADIHQPMHCCSRVNSENTRGDYGGNRCKINPIPYGEYRGRPSSLDNLHKLWDSGVCFFEPEADMYAEDLELFKKYEKQVNSYYNTLEQEEKFQINNRMKNHYIEEWVEESYDYACKYAYNDISEDPLSEEYINTGQNLCMEQILVAANRLADYLNEIF